MYQVTPNTMIITNKYLPHIMLTNISAECTATRMKLMKLLQILITPKLHLLKLRKQYMTQIETPLIVIWILLPTPNDSLRSTR